MNAHAAGPRSGRTPPLPPPPPPPAARISAELSLRAYEERASAPAAELNAWARRPEIPTPREIWGQGSGEDGGPSVVELPTNTINGPWESKEEYLRSHYELLREDATAPLRDAVDEVRGRPDMRDTGEISIYEKVHIVGFVFSSKGLAARVAFSTARAGKKILWEQSKRLMPGTLLAMTPVSDRFENQCKMVIVGARPLAGVQRCPPEVDLFFPDAADIEIDPQQEWLMVEARTGYFESYRHVLTGLQRIMSERFPMSENLIHLKRKVESPAHVRRAPLADLSALFGDSGDRESFANVNILEEFPESPSAELDRSQVRALRTILTKRLAIVQGPPGTGKTHVSVVALKVLLDRMSDLDPPLIIASHTNHALDQLLRLVSVFEPDFIRLGGGSTDLDVIKPRTLYEVRQKNKAPFVLGGLQGPASALLRRLEENMAVLLEPLQQQNRPLSAAFLHNLGLLRSSQVESLEGGASTWVKAFQSQESLDPIAKWLGEDLVRVDCQWQTEDFGFEFEEPDLEFEQLKELEAEGGVSEDAKVDWLSGKWVPIAEDFTAREYSGVTSSLIEEALRNDDLWAIPENLRSGIYRHFQTTVKNAILKAIRHEAKAYFKAVQQVKLGRWENDFPTLSKARVIGMTTTGLSKYRPLIASLRPRIILVEEAAETLEGQIAAGCVESLEHLILVGDHKQLRGHCSVAELEGEPYNLGISMFERLVDNGVQFSTLTRQRRMIPEIRRILAPIYSKLDDHPSVREREGIPGMGGVNTFFFTHRWPESKDNFSSCWNDMEVKMVVGFFNYLVYNGMPSGEITVLTFYNGQRKAILRSLKHHPSLQGLFFKVKTVDSYQGEENGVVLLSLARSNDRKNIGFLSIENRVCVALSRAQRGFYIFGNALNLCRASQLWWKVMKIMSEKPRRVGFAFPLACTTHGRKTWIRDPREWESNDGGCHQKCTETLPCGHGCRLHCHPFPHSRIPCKDRCQKILSCDHACVQVCGSDNCRCQNSCKSRPENLISSTDEVPRGKAAWQAFARDQGAAADAASREPAKAIKLTYAQALTPLIDFGEDSSPPDWPALQAVSSRPPVVPTETEGGGPGPARTKVAEVFLINQVNSHEQADFDATMQPSLLD